jgi:hypothetical protein
MHCQLLTVLNRVAPTATNALCVGACPKLVCGALVTVMRMMFCVCLTVIVMLLGRTRIIRSGRVISLHIAA